MADGETHLIAGIATGTAAAAYTAREQPGVDFMAELIGSALGGAIGGNLPDILEPATHSWHRSTAHSLVTATTIGITAASSIFPLGKTSVALRLPVMMTYVRVQRMSWGVGGTVSSRSYGAL